MKTTARTLTGWITVALCLSTCFAVAGPLPGTTDLLVGVSPLMQAGQTQAPAGDNRSKADDLLRRARQAMKENDLSAADSLISAAETLDVQYSVLHLGDSPKKARRDLQQMQQAAGKSPTRPSQAFSPSLFGKTETPRTDPFASRSGNLSTTPAEVQAGATQSPLMADRGGSFDQPLAGTDAREVPPGLSMASRDNPVRSATSAAGQPMQSPFGRDVITTPPDRADLPSPSMMAAQTSELPTNIYGRQVLGPQPLPTGSASQRLPGSAAASPDRGTVTVVASPLLEARRALAVGDIARATRFVAQAKLQPAGNGPSGETPEAVEAAIEKYKQYNDPAVQRDASESYRRGRAKMFMEQAEALLGYGDYATAEQLAGEAARQRVEYAPFEPKPEDLIRRIGVARRSGDNPSSRPSPIEPTTQSANMPAPSMAARQKAIDLCRQARQAMETGQLPLAESLARQAEQLRIPDALFAPGQDRPGIVLLDIRMAAQRAASGMTASGTPLVQHAGGTAPADHTASRALYDAANDPTRNLPAAYQQPATPGGFPAGGAQIEFGQPTPMPGPPEALPSPPPAPGSAGVPMDPGIAMSAFQQGETALKAHDTARAYEFFRQAAGGMDQLDPDTRQRLQGYLQLLSAPNRNKPAVAGGSIVEETAAAQLTLARQVAADVAIQEGRAMELRATDPKAALSLLEETRKRIEAAGLEPQSREQLLRRADRALADTRQFIEQNRPRIELEEKSQRTTEDIARQQRLQLDNQDKLALMVDEFNKLMDEQRYAEAEVVAKRAEQLDPENPVIVQLINQVTFVRRFMSNQSLRDAKEIGFWEQMNSVDESSVGFNDNNPIQFGNLKNWEELTKRRGKMFDRNRNRSERELEIEQKLKTPISLQFTGAPLKQVLDHLAQLAQITMFIDPQGLAEEGVTSDTPVTIDVRGEIMLKSALNLILEPLHMSYVIKDEVLKITSEQRREGEVYPVMYNVADLVIPIPNFKASPRMGLAGAYHDALGNVGLGGGATFGGGGGEPMAVLASRDGGGAAGAINPALLAQISAPGPASGAASLPMGFGPGGLGGGSQADFDSLIELITATIQPTTWDDVGGPGSIKEFETNLSLVISQTQEVHEEIVDLLEQLRRLQDLQVTIEVRFITLNDNFFERIGVDFDFDIADRSGISQAQIDALVSGGTGGGGGGGGGTTNPAIPSNDIRDLVGGRTITVGMQAPGVFSADLDIPFTQNNFGLAVPQFGGFDATAGAQLGFAILSDIEAFFFINAAEGDRRSNVLQAPKVTLFNGQQAVVSDTSQSPFVISVIPVVGDFAAAQQPVIVVLSEGTFMTVQAVVSNDRRFVRLTVVPFFSKIGDVNTFQFTGSTTTTDDTSTQGNQENPNDQTAASSNKSTTKSGTTVQLPTFSYVTVTTTVSVPDGGTVLLGGIKRLSEGRNEFGVPLLDKVPYVNRLFKNVGIGRETQSLMMMVTPRIIIQEEEEEKLGILPPAT